MILQSLTTVQKYLVVTFCCALISGCGGGGGDSSVGAALIGAGGGGSGGGSSSNTPAPQITSLTATPSVAEVGETLTISWASSNATSCTATGDWSGSKDTSGTESFTATKEQTYNIGLTCSGNGSDSKVVYVEVDDPYTEGTCVNPHTAEFNKDFMGDFDIPVPYGVVPDGSVKSVGLKDYGVRWIYQNYSQFTDEDWIDNCTVEQYSKLQYRLTLMRLKEHGVEEVTLYNFGRWEDAYAAQWTVAKETMHLTRAELEYIAQTAQSLGLKLKLTLQLLPVDKNNVWLFPFDGQLLVDRNLINKLMDAWEKTIVEAAKEAEFLGFSSISADWSAMYVCFCGLENQYGYGHPEREAMKDIYMTRMSEIIDQIRNEFRGDIYAGDGMIWNDRRVIDKVDYVYLSFGNILNEEENKNPTLELLTTKIQDDLERFYYNWYCLDGQYCPPNPSNRNVPWVVQLFHQSTRNFLHTGWVEDGFCTDGQPGDMGGATNAGEDRCVQYDVDIDFSLQALATEATLRAVYLQTIWTNIRGVTTSTAYWLSDSLQPAEGQTRQRTIEGFPNISQSIRGKPAEKILKYWYTGEYEVYDPKFID